MKIAFLGAGKVGAPLAAHLAAAGHEVVLASTKESSTSLGARSPKLRIEALPEAVRRAEVVFLATPFSAKRGRAPPYRLASCRKGAVDCTNPVGPGLTHGLRSERSGSELVQSLVPEARVVKAFSLYGERDPANGFALDAGGEVIERPAPEVRSRQRAHRRPARHVLFLARMKRSRNLRISCSSRSTSACPVM